MNEIRQVTPPTFDELAKKYPKKFSSSGLIHKPVDCYAKMRKQIKAKNKRKELSKQKKQNKTLKPVVELTNKKPIHIPQYMNTWYADGFWNQDGCGFVVCDANKEVMSEMVNLPEFWSKNQCEYEAVLNALTIIPDKALLCSDSQLVVKQINGDYTCNCEHLIPLRNKCRELIKQSRVKILWVRREQNLAGHIIEERQNNG